MDLPSSSVSFHLSTLSTDYLKRNIEIIQTWLDDKPGQVDFQPFFDFAGKCIGRGYDII